MGIGPDFAEEVADFLAVEIGQADAVRAGIREALVLAAGAGELRVEIEGMSDIADDDEGRTAFRGGEGVDVALRLGMGADEGLIEGGGAALAVADGLADGGCTEGREQRLVGIGLVTAGIDALFRLEDEVARFVEVDPVGGGGAVGFFAIDAALEGVAVELVSRDGGGGFFETE